MIQDLYSVGGGGGLHLAGALFYLAADGFKGGAYGLLQRIALLAGLFLDFILHRTLIPADVLFPYNRLRPDYTLDQNRTGASEQSQPPHKNSFG